MHNGKKYKVTIIGAFDFKGMDTGGQPVKTRELYYALRNKYGKEEIGYIETVGWKKQPLRLIRTFVKHAKNSSIMIMLPAWNGVDVFSRLLVYAKQKYGIKIFYDVIGGWLPDKINKKQRLKKVLANFDAIFVETQSMKNVLLDENIINVAVMNNFKRLNSVSVDNLKVNYTYPLKICTFSRVVKEKGIEDAIKAVIKINENKKAVLLQLDIFGYVYEAYKNEFGELMKDVPSYIKYKGVVLPNESTGVLKDYHALLFPTHFYTEGIPGTIIDAYAAGIPVISAKWCSFSDVIDDGETGIGYEFDSFRDLEHSLNRVVENPEILIQMGKNCLKKSKEYTPKSVMEKLVKYFD